MVNNRPDIRAHARGGAASGWPTPAAHGARLPLLSASPPWPSHEGGGGLPLTVPSPTTDAVLPREGARCSARESDQLGLSGSPDHMAQWPDHVLCGPKLHFKMETPPLPDSVSNLGGRCHFSETIYKKGNLCKDKKCSAGT